LNLVPAVARSFTRVREAERLRGGPGRQGLRGLLALIVPVALTTIESSITLAEAMEARAYGSGTRTIFRTVSTGVRDWVVLVPSTAGLAAMVLLRATGVALDWYPFPTATIPEVSVVAVLACLALAAPLLARRQVSAPTLVTSPAAST
jgi:energy-coupling factor transport system permease protein